MSRLSGKVALVTGGAMGIGRACAEKLAVEGASVVVTDVADDEGAQTVSAIEAAGGTALYLHHDVTVESAWQDVITAITERFSRLDILVNNAGIAIAAPITEMTLDQFRQQNAVNLDGVFLGMKHCIPVIAKGGNGSILSSVAGLKASPNLAAYAMTKGGVRLLSKSVAKECAAAGLGVRVNSVHPGIIETAIWDKMGLPGTEGQNQVDTEAIAAGAVPGGKLGKPSDIANMVAFLASDESSYVNGAEMVVDHAFSA